MSAKANQPVFQRRQRRRDHYHTIDRTIIFAYPGLSDGARLTYIVLDSYDWAQHDGSSKGYVYPYQSTLAKIRGTTERTIRRHLDELIDAGLITVEVMATATGRRNIYWIEEATQEEFEHYLQSLAKPQLTGDEDKNVLTHEDKNVRMGEDKNVLYKDSKSKDSKVEGQDKTRSGPVESSSQDEPIRPDEETPPEKAERVLGCFADIVGRSPTKLEQEHLTRLISTYGSWEVERALNELLAQLDLQHIQNPTRYLAGVLENWRKEGPRSTDIVAHLRRMSSQK